MDEFKERKAIEYAFIRLLGALSIVKEHQSFKEDKYKFDNIYNTVIKEATKYISECKAVNLNINILEKIYDDLFKLSSKWLFDQNIGEEAMLMDDLEIWSYALIERIEKIND